MLKIFVLILIELAVVYDLIITLKYRKIEYDGLARFVLPVLIIIQTFYTRNSNITYSDFITVIIILILMVALYWYFIGFRIYLIPFDLNELYDKVILEIEKGTSCNLVQNVSFLWGIKPCILIKETENKRIIISLVRFINIKQVISVNRLIKNNINNIQMKDTNIWFNVIFSAAWSIFTLWIFMIK